ncbi:hypothetical protein DYB28_013814, partial [Aphanomyces astaci]
MAKNSKDRAQKPKAAVTAPAAASSETEEEVPVTEPPLVPVVGGTTDVLPAVEESKSEEVRKTMEELAAANKAMGSARAASMTWDESRRRYGGQTMGPNWEQLPRPPIEGAYVDEDYPPPEKSDAEKRAEEKAEARAKLRAERRNRPDSTPDSEEEEKEYQEQRKQAERRRINKANRPAKEKRVDHAKVARAAHDRRMLDTTLPSSSGWGPLTSGPPTPSSGGWGPNFNSNGPSLVVTDVQPPRITCMDRTFLVSWVKKRETYEDKLRANAQRMGGEWRRSAVGWIPSTDRSLLKATCTYVWRVPVEQLSEDDYRDRIMEIVGQPATKWTPTKSDMQNYCRTLSVDPHGDVTSRLVSFMERVDDVIDENGLRQQLKDSTMLRTFVKVVAARVTPSYLRDRVEEQMKTVPANDLVAFADILREQLDRTHDADMVNQQRNSYGSKRGREEDDQGRRITKHAKKANQATAAGPVKVPGKRRCYVVNDGDEFLVSDDTLKTIGIDIDRLLEQVARLQVDEDGDDLEEVGGDCVELPQR